MSLAALMLFASDAMAQPAPKPTGSAKPAEEDSTPTPTSTEPRARAKALAMQAQDAIDAGDDQIALTLLLEADAIYHAPTIQLLIARTYEKLGRRSEALTAYRVLTNETLPADASDAFRNAQAVARTELLALEGELSYVVIESDVGDTTVRVAGKLVKGKGPHLVESGRPVEVSVSAPGKPPVVRSVSVDKGKTETLAFALAEKPVPVEVSDWEKMGRSAAPTIIALATTTAGLTLGIVAGIGALDNAAALEEACPAKKCPGGDAEAASFQASARVLGDVSTAGFIVAGVGAAASVVFLVQSDFGARWGDIDGPPETSVFVIPHHEGLYVGFAGSF